MFFNVGPTFFSSSDPYWNDVILLLNGTGPLSKDSSIFNNVMLPSEDVCPMYFDYSMPLFGNPSYAITQCLVEPPPFYSSTLRLTDSNRFFNNDGKIGANEFCLETWVNIDFTAEPSYRYEYSWYQDNGPYFDSPAQVCQWSRSLYPGDPGASTMDLSVYGDGYCREYYGTGSRYIVPYVHLIQRGYPNGIFCNISGITIGRTPGTDGIFANINIGGEIQSIGTGASGFFPDRWYHIAVVRDNTTDPDTSILKIFIGGSLSAWSTNFISKDAELIQNNDLAIGYNGMGSFGWISNLRFTKNHARYYSAFNTPYAPFPTY